MIDIDEDLGDGILLLVDVHVHWLKLSFMIADEFVVREDEEKLVSTPAWARTWSRMSHVDELHEKDTPHVENVRVSTTRDVDAVVTVLDV